jgi:HAD superfamily hydrolase (TIGR01450 family)
MRQENWIGVILAAGVGSRLRPITQHMPKCLIKVAGRAMLDYQLDTYLAAGISKVVIAIGYEGRTIIDHCKHIKDLNVQIVENADYEETNNMYSLYLLREHVAGRPFLLNNADLVVERHLIRRMIEAAESNLIAVDSSLYNDESMKVAVRADGTISDIAKTIKQPESFGCSIDFYKFSAGASKVFFTAIDRIIEQEMNRKEWTEVAMQRLFKAGHLAFKALDVAGMKWKEIDNYDDLAIADRTFSDWDKWRAELRAYYFDLDGTLYVGNRPIPGAAEAVNKLRQGGRKVFFISNNSSMGHSEYVQKLASLGIQCRDDEIILSTGALISFLKQRKVRSIYPLGTKTFCSILSAAGMILDDKAPEYVVVGYDTELTYAKLVTACRLINQGVDYVATHADNFCPSEFGPLPDAGALLKLLEVATGHAPAHVLGKPSPDMVRYHIEQQGVRPDQCAMVGDRLHTDMAMASAVGMRRIAVLSGETTREMIERSPHFPDVVLKTAAELA